MKKISRKAFLTKIGLIIPALFLGKKILNVDKKEVKLPAKPRIDILQTPAETFNAIDSYMNEVDEYVKNL